MLRERPTPTTERERVKHTMNGSPINPRCVTCGRNAMEIQRAPYALCERMTLPFGELPKPTPAKATLRSDVATERVS
ncbi:MAG TPA: hypothetical protein VFA59_16895 [Vicinamibacterales bacterium]|nr:hypothetical protein [Vicinamibacterales bacterium]